jgi:hypothetical protein
MQYIDQLEIKAITFLNRFISFSAHTSRVGRTKTGKLAVVGITSSLQVSHKNTNRVLQSKLASKLHHQRKVLECCNSWRKFDGCNSTTDNFDTYKEQAEFLLKKIIALILTKMINKNGENDNHIICCLLNNTSKNVAVHYPQPGHLGHHQE